MTRAPADPQNLGEHLRERTRVLHAGGGLCADDAPVLYWMHHAVRADENPALDVAVTMAEQLDRPLLVYQGLGGSHPFNNDRHHTFILEGARDVAAELAERGLAHVFHLGAQPNARSPLRDLAARAAIVIVEDFPAPPFKRWTANLAAHAAAAGVAVWAVDASCIVPMSLAGRRFDRAFAFRDHLAAEFRARVTRAWPVTTARARLATVDAAWLGFAPVDWSAQPIDELVARCDIDHSVGPVPHTRGGTRAALERWSRFLGTGLRSYHQRRNNAAVDGVSRMSAYLHHGHVSAMRLARDAAAIGGEGADKFLDELFTWRELSFNYCMHTPDHELESSAALPEWARATLRAHARDPRPRTHDAETLARGQTDDELWNLAQRSLLAHGELHNNIRMTWGKALLGWTRGPGEALERLIELNHRYALDGSDPNSYGGLLWCLGLFDRPFTPEQPVLGTVRPRPTAEHARRIDLKLYRRRVTRPVLTRGSERLRIAVIGAGVTGLIAARTLADHHVDVVVFDKGRGPGGRISTRRMATDEGPELVFDHGGPCFTVRHPVVARWARAWQRSGLIVPWPRQTARMRGREIIATDETADRFTVVGGMHGLARRLADGLEVRCGSAVQALSREARGWMISREGAEPDGPFHGVICTAPAPQTSTLLQSCAPALAGAAQAARYAPCWALMLAVNRPLATHMQTDAARVEESPIAWISREHRKPGRQLPDGVETWVAHASPAWSREHLELTPEAAAESLLAALADVLDCPPIRELIKAVAHRWRYALVEQAVGATCLFDRATLLAAAGDWCVGPRIEAAICSGVAAAGRIMGAVAADMPPDDTPWPVADDAQTGAPSLFG